MGTDDFDSQSSTEILCSVFVWFLSFFFFFLKDWFFSNYVFCFFAVNQAEDDGKKKKKSSWAIYSCLLWSKSLQKPVRNRDAVLYHFNHSHNIFEHILFAFPPIFVQQKWPLEVFPLLKSSSDSEIMHCISRFHTDFDVLKSSELCKVARNKREWQK